MNDLRSEKCRCGRAKEIKKPLCKDCYFGLPGALRKALYCRLGAGFERAYTQALEFLRLWPRDGV